MNWDAVITRIYTLNNIGSLKKNLQYYYHATPGEPCKCSPGVAWYSRVPSKEPILLRVYECAVKYELCCYVIFPVHGESSTAWHHFGWVNSPVHGCSRC